MGQIYEQVVNDIENKDTHCMHWLPNADYFTYIYSRRVLIFWQTEDVQNGGAIFETVN